MTEKEYLDPRKFPATTQEGLDLKSQMMIDAHNFDALREHQGNGGQLDAEQKARMAELKIKMKA